MYLSGQGDCNSTAQPSRAFLLGQVWKPRLQEIQQDGLKEYEQDVNAVEKIVIEKRIFLKETE